MTQKSKMFKTRTSGLSNVIWLMQTKFLGALSFSPPLAASPRLVPSLSFPLLELLVGLVLCSQGGLSFSCPGFGPALFHATVRHYFVSFLFFNITFLLCRLPFSSACHLHSFHTFFLHSIKKPRCSKRRKAQLLRRTS